MNYPTKQKRLVAIFDAYCKRFAKTGATMDEVSEWALSEGLYPCPKRGDPENICNAWETKLKDATMRKPVELYDEQKLQAIIDECNEHNEDIGAGERDPERVRQDAKNIYMHRHNGITVETICMMLTDYRFAKLPSAATAGGTAK
jgi:hypothetical protein